MSSGLTFIDSCVLFGKWLMVNNLVNGKCKLVNFPKETS